MANEIHTLNIGNTSYTIQSRLLGPMSIYSNGAPCPSISGVIQYDTAIGDNPFGASKSSGMNNAVLSISRTAELDGYTSQLGFSRYGIYGRWFYDKLPDTTTPWRRFIMDDGVDTLNIDTPNFNVIGNVSGGKGRSKINITTDDFTINHDTNIGNGIVYKSLDRITVWMNDMGGSIGPYIFTNKKVYYNSSAGNLPNASTSANSLREYYVWVLDTDFERFMNYNGSSSQQFSIAFTESGNVQNVEVAGHGNFTFIPSENYFIPDEVYTNYSISEYDSSDELVLEDINTNIYNNGNGMRIDKDRVAIMSSEAGSIDIIGDEINIINHSNDIGNIHIGSNIGTDCLYLNSENYIFIGDSESEVNPYLWISANSINISGGAYHGTSITLGNDLAAGEGYSQTVNTYCDIIPQVLGGNTVDIGSTNSRFTNIYSLQSYATNGFFQTSDERLKNFGDNIKVDFDALAKLRKAYFTWNDNPDITHIGVSAQEVREIYPEVVTETDGQLSVDYAKLSVVALAAVDELHKKNVELEARLAKLEAMLLK